MIEHYLQDRWKTGFQLSERVIQKSAAMAFQVVRFRTIIKYMEMMGSPLSDEKIAKVWESMGIIKRPPSNAWARFSRKR